MPAAPVPASDTVRSYLARLGLEPEPPSSDALIRLHRAHVERIPWETLWIHLGERWSIDPASSLIRIAGQGRGGYCFHLNGALAALLRALGYDVVLHVGGVHGPAEPSPGDMANHLVLTVRGLPTGTNPDGVWYVDTGLGDALHAPLPLLPGVYRQGPFRFVLDAAHGGGWRLTHDPSGGFYGMTWRAAPAGMHAFAGQHKALSTSPESGFVRVLTVQRRDATGVDTLRSRTLRRTGTNATETRLDSRHELVDALTGIFGIDLTAVTGHRLDALWDQVLRAHEAWLASRES
jgi:arylamine N-acetyltransferase